MQTTMNEVIAELTKAEYIITDPKEGLVLVCDRRALEEGIPESVKRLYRITDQKQGLVEKIDIDGARRMLVEKVRDKVDLNQMLEQALRTAPPEDVLEALRRVCEGGEKKVEPRKGCYSLVFRGRKGQKPVELVLAQ